MRSPCAERAAPELDANASAPAHLLSGSPIGIGIRAADQSRLFTPFSRVAAPEGAASEGTGLGLHLSQKLAGLLGGHISVASEYGAGSTFTLTLPAE